MKTINIVIPEKTTTYPIVIGSNIVEQLPSLIEINEYTQVVIITDEHIQQLWLPKLLQSFQRSPHVIVLPAGEKSKNIHSVEVIWKEMQASGCDRKSLVITLGGGVIGDMGGFAASTYMRGVDFLQIPTSLLAAVDASIGGKTGINFVEVKNLIGAFQQPIGVFIDILILQTLPEREFVSGFAEIIKHGLIRDAAYFAKVTEKKPKDFSQDELIEIIAGSCEIEAAIIAQDEKEQNIRKFLNFGHTIGHAIEALSWETSMPLLHGEAIAIGMAAETEISKRVGLISQETVQIVRHKIKEAGLPTKVKEMTINEIMEKIVSDKKNVSGKTKWVLLKHIGEAIYDQEVEQGIVVQAIENILA